MIFHGFRGGSDTLRCVEFKSAVRIQGKHPEIYNILILVLVSVLVLVLVVLVLVLVLGLVLVPVLST